MEPCESKIIHHDIVRRVRKEIPSKRELYSLAEFFKLFGDSTRLGILLALAQAEMCVCDVSALLSMTQSAVSHQLRLLKQQRVVKYRREGKTVYYSLDDHHVQELLIQGLDHNKEFF